MTAKGNGCYYYVLVGLYVVHRAQLTQDLNIYIGFAFAFMHAKSSTFLYILCRLQETDTDFACIYQQ